jgi:hypothetical protein
MRQNLNLRIAFILGRREYSILEAVAHEEEYNSKKQARTRYQKQPNSCFRHKY